MFSTKDSFLLVPGSHLSASNGDRMKLHVPHPVSVLLRSDLHETLKQPTFPAGTERCSSETQDASPKLNFSSAVMV